MNTIIITCPKCHNKNKVPKPEPTEKGTHVLCSHCHYLFKLVPKIRTDKTAKTAKPAAKQVPPANSDHSGNNVKQQPLLQPSINREQPAAAQKIATPQPEPPQPSINTLLSRPMPESADKKAAPQKQPSHSSLAEASVKAILSKLTGKPIAEQLPAVVDTPPAEPDADQQTPPPEWEKPSAGSSTVNNLVFTLLSAQEHHEQRHEQADVPLLLNDTIEKTENISVTQKILTEQQAKLHHEFNWTLASLVALTVLIIQLFYLMTVK